MDARRAFVGALVAIAVAAPAVHGTNGDGGDERSAATAAARPAPRLLAPADEARTEQVPTFSWRRVARAAAYEIQVAADPSFDSIVLGRNLGSFKTRNTYATLERTLPDGTYYWRVRAIDRRERAGRWASTRSFVKSWTTQPELIAPSDSAAIQYPGTPLVLRWTAVPRAYKYLVTVATDESLASSLVGRNGEPQETQGTSLAVPNALSPGVYYWGVTPVDARGHRGRPSVVGSFRWGWNSGTTLNPPNLERRVPELTWASIPGAVEYELEINSSGDFAPGSRVCCSPTTTATAFTPTKVIANNEYYWRVRGIDFDGNTGQWNQAPASFTQSFNPSVPNLHLRDHDTGFIPVDPASPPSVEYPIIEWDFVPGASTYEVQVAPVEGGACNWTSDFAWDVFTAATAWTPLSPVWNGEKPGSRAYPQASKDRGSNTLVNGTSYCVQVLARSGKDILSRDVIGRWTQLGGSQGAFTYTAPAFVDAPPGDLATPDANYLSPRTGSGTFTRLPLFTWQPVPGAKSYFVVVARDPEFTRVIDLAITHIPAYAPRAGENPMAYPDETTSYYWAVVPARDPDGDLANTLPEGNHAQRFEKRSEAPGLITPPPPLPGQSPPELSVQPTFSWAQAEGARDYTLQIAQDDSFGDPIEEVTTAGTSYTTAATYPADTDLYWRVRANDELRNGLSWSTPPGRFRRVLAPPVASRDVGAGPEGIPVLSWDPVQGAAGYDVQFEWVDGRTTTDTTRSTAATPVVFYGNGVWRWKVRARFKAGARTVTSAYTPAVPFHRELAKPAGARARKTRDSLLLSWEPVYGAKRYRVEISSTDSFSRVIDTHTTDNTSYAPRLTQPGYHEGRRLYWRIVALDEGNNPGGQATGALRGAKAMRIRVRASLRRDRRGVARVTVLDSRRRRLRGATVTVTGVATARSLRTGRRGTVTFRLHPHGAGRVVFRAVKPGYQPVEKVVRVR